MPSENFHIPLRNGDEIAGTAYGMGRRLIVCWHGYGQSRRLFLPLLDVLPADARVVMIDLPLFGKRPPGDVSAARSAENTAALEMRDLDAFLQALLQRYPADRIELVAFSLGAKLALGLYQSTVTKIDRMVLISPDGLRIHPLYRFCIYHPVGKALFYTVLRWPALFLMVLRALYHLRITDAFKYRFVARQFDAPHKRDLLRRVWQGFSLIRPDLPTIAGRSAATQTEWHVIWGATDNVLPMKLCQDFIQTVNGAKLHVVEGGHFLLQPPTAEVKALIQSIMNA